MSLSNDQKKAYLMLPVVPSMISLLGSSTLAFRVITREEKKTPYERILLGLSCFDILHSINTPLYGFLVDSENIDAEWAVGNKASCNATAFLFQTAFASSILYNAGLSLYFLATIRFGMTQERFSRRLEPLLHFFVITYPLSCAIAGLALDMYEAFDGSRHIGCYVSYEYEAAGWLFYLIPFLLSMFSITVCNIIIYVFVRKTIQRSQGNSMNSELGATQIRKVAVQAFLYVGSFISSYMWEFILEFLTWNRDDLPTLYPIMVLNALFFPMQGLWNCLIFFRPRYLKFRSAFADGSRVAAMHWVVFGNDDVFTPKKKSSSCPISEAAAAAEAVVENCSTENESG